MRQTSSPFRMVQPLQNSLNHRLTDGYLKRLLPSNLNSVEIHVDLEIDQFQQYLRPFMKSAVMWSFDRWAASTDCRSAIQPISSISKTVVGLIDQLCLLQCTGFTFPEYKDKECVAKVCIKWSKFSFYIDYTPLSSMGRFQQEIALAITESLKFINLTRRL